ncbi:metallophosphoesterase, partial [Faecalicoccus pleomorphus]
VVKKGNVKIALIGVMGNDSIEDTPTTKLKFKDPIKSVKQTVAEIKRKEKVDMIVCLSHSGTSQTKTSEDEELAKKVPDLDLIISGHTHTVLNKPLRHGQTYIVSCGAYGRYTGLVKLKQKLNHRWKLVDYRLISMTQAIPKDQQVEKQLRADTAL